MCLFRLLKIFIPIAIIGVVVYFVFFFDTSQTDESAEALLHLNSIF